MTEQISIKKGFYLVERKKGIPFSRASSYLNSRRLRHVTSAEEKKHGVEITVHSYRCPFCGKEVFAYEHESALPSREDLAEWCDLQLNMFSNKPKPRLDVQAPFTDRRIFFCPRCGMESQRSDETFSLTLEVSDEFIKLSRTVEGVDQLLQIPWLKVVDLAGNEKLSEAVIFDLTLGSTVLTLENGLGCALVSHHLRKRVTPEEIGFFGKLLTHHTVVKRRLKAAFQTFCAVPIPFTLRELDFNHFSLLSAFHGFPRSFYDAVPWDRETGWIAEDFHFPADFLHTPNQALSLLPKYGFPPAKSVKRVFTTNPGLFFYLPECKTLWELLEDPNYFCTLMHSDRIFYLLANFHQFPGTELFYRDFKACRDTRSLLKMLKNNFSSAHHRAVAYAALSEGAREKVKERIRRDEDCSEYSYERGDRLMFSYPLATLPKNGQEISIGRFRFKWLKTTADAAKAGIELDNCLVHWEGNRNHVAVVLDGREYLAAIEVEKDTVVQFLGKSNVPIEDGSELCTATQKWAKHFSFMFHEDSFDDLPF